MLRGSFIPILLAIVFAAPVRAEDGSPFGPTVVAPKDSTVSIVRYNDDDQLLDTLVVVAKGRLDRKIPVNKYVEVIDAIAFPLRHVYLVGYRSMQIIETTEFSTHTYGSGVWKTFGSVRAGKVRFMLHARDGTVTDITPRLE